MTTEDKAKALKEFEDAVKIMDGKGMILTATTLTDDNDEETATTQCKILIAGHLVSVDDIVPVVVSPVRSIIKRFSEAYTQSLSMTILHILAKNLNIETEIKKDNQ